MKCPNCGLINPDIALRCDCGYRFDRLPASPLTTPLTPRQRPLLPGLLVILGGVVLLGLPLVVNRAIAVAAQTPNRPPGVLGLVTLVTAPLALSCLMAPVLFVAGLWMIARELRRRP